MPLTARGRAPGAAGRTTALRSGLSSADVWNVSIILGVCALAAHFRWCKLNSLVRDDPAMWLSQAARAAQGELPYRDFSWNYPPFAILCFGYVLKIFGIGFVTAQAAQDALSLVVVALAYWIVRYLLPPTLHVAIITLLVIVGATAQTKFTLFSLLTYSPSLQFATAGLLMVMIGQLRYVRRGRLDWASWSLLGTGSYVSALSKPESLVGAWSSILLLAVIDRRLWYQDQPARRWFRHYAVLLIVCIGPAVLTYATVARRVGLENLAAGISGYGLASFACPWWPTGVGIFGALAALGQAVSIAALALLLFRSAWNPVIRPYVRRWALLVLPALVLYAGYIAYLNAALLASGVSPGRKLAGLAPTLLWTNPVLLPVMWVSICYWSYLALRFAAGRRLAAAELETLLLLGPPVIMASRGLFGTTLEPFTEVSAICYAFFLILGPVLLWRFLSFSVASPSPSDPRPARRISAVVAALALGYSAVRVAGAFRVMISDDGYRTLSTRAGDVKLYGDDGSADIYRFVAASTRESDTLLEIPYGGGINFATGLRSPAFTTQYTQLRMPDRYQLRDLDGVRSRRPKYVIADDLPRLGTTYGYIANLECPYPRLVWEPDQPSWDPNRTYPVVRFIEDNYRVERKIASKLILAPR